MKDGNKLTSKDCVELEVMLRRLDALAFASGGFEPARSEAAALSLAAICKYQAAVGEAQAALSIVSGGQVQGCWGMSWRWRRGLCGIAEELRSSQFCRGRGSG